MKTKTTNQLTGLRSNLNQPFNTSYSDCKAEPARQNDVDAATDSLEKANEALYCAVYNLIPRLSPVSRPAAPVADESAGKAIELKAPLADKLNAEVAKIYNLVNSLESATRLLEI